MCFAKLNTYINMKEVKMNTFKEDLKKLKNYFNARNFKHLSEILEISYAAIDAWKRRKSLPVKYKKHIQDKKNTYIDSDLKEKIFVELNKLSEKKQEYIYHLIMAEVLRES